MPAMSAVEQVFCRSAPWRAVARRLILPWVLQGVEPSGDLLELGAGDGAMADATLRSHGGLHVTVTDIDPRMIRAARGRFHGVVGFTATQADATDLPYPDASFDFVASYLMLHHVVDWQQAISEAARVLRPGGTLVGYDLARTRLAAWVHWADRSPYRLIEPHEITPALAAAGLDAWEVQDHVKGHVFRFTACKPMAPHGGASTARRGTVNYDAT